MLNSYDNIIQLKKRQNDVKLFRNASLVDFETGEINLVDILVYKDKISKITPAGEDKNVYEFVENINEGFVIPPFVNHYCDSLKAFNSYGLEIDKDVSIDVNDFKFKVYGGNSDKSEDIAILNLFCLMQFTNYLAGAVHTTDFSALNNSIIEKIEDKTEKDLDDLCNLYHKSKLSPVFRVGLDLNELGSVDKIYKKPLVQVLEDFGLLDFDSSVFIGGNCFEKDDLELLRQHDCKFIITPYDDGRDGRRPVNLIRLKNMDFCVGLGSGHSFEIDFFEYMRLMISQMRSVFEDKDCFTEKNALKIALGGEKSLKEGEEASFIVIKNEDSLYDDIFKTLVWEKSNKDITLTVDCGEIVQKNRKIVMQDALNYDTLKLIAKLFSRRNKNDN